MPYRPQIKKLDYYESGGSGSPSEFITEGDDGILYMYFETPGTGETWRGYINASGEWVIESTTDLAYFLLESGDFFLLESGDKLILG